MFSLKLLKVACKNSFFKLPMTVSWWSIIYVSFQYHSCECKIRPRNNKDRHLEKFLSQESCNLCPRKLQKPSYQDWWTNFYVNAMLNSPTQVPNRKKYIEIFLTHEPWNKIYTTKRVCCITSHAIYFKGFSKNLK